MNVTHELPRWVTILTTRIKHSYIDQSVLIGLKNEEEAEEIFIPKSFRIKGNSIWDGRKTRFHQMAGKTPVIFNKFNVAKMSLKNLLFLKNRWNLWNEYTRYGVLKIE